MKTQTRMAAIPVIVLCSLLTVGRRHDTASAQTHSTKQNVAVSGLLDVILQGPFVIERNTDHMTVLIPQVTNHTVPVFIDANVLQPTPLNAGTYNLTITNSTPGNTQIKNPVVGTMLLTAKGKTEGLKSDPNNLHYLVITMPLPQEVVPWNADPVWLSSSPMPPQPDPLRAAVMLVLRFSYTASSVITLTGTESGGTAITHTLKGIAVGQEHMIGMLQGMKIPDVTHHTTAAASFEKMKELEPQIARYLDFPDVGTTPGGRNLPLITGVVPLELTDFLTSYGSTSTAVAQGRDEAYASFDVQLHALIGHSDCKAPVIYVDYTQ